jgi:hypothetical protein
MRPHGVTAQKMTFFMILSVYSVTSVYEQSILKPFHKCLIYLHMKLPHYTTEFKYILIH